MGQGDPGQLEVVGTALDGIREALEADGYRLHIGGLEAATLALRVEATPGACEECLIPKEYMTQMIESSLPASLGVRKIDLTYPAEGHGH